MLQNSTQRVYSLRNTDDDLIKTYIINVPTSSAEASRKRLLLDYMDMTMRSDTIIKSVEEFDNLLDALLARPFRLL
jgi:hypothetical protein